MFYMAYKCLGALYVNDRKVGGGVKREIQDKILNIKTLKWRTST